MSGLKTGIAKMGYPIADTVCQIHDQGQAGTVEREERIILPAADDPGDGDVTDGGEILIDGQTGFQRAVAKRDAADMFLHSYGCVDGHENRFVFSQTDPLQGLCEIDSVYRVIQ